LVANSWWAGVADGAIWSFSAISDPPRISRFDLTEQVFSSIDVDLPITEECCIATDDAIWLVSHINVMRLDTATLEVTEVTALGPGLFRGIAAAGALWLPNPQADTIYRFDPALGQVTDIISVCCEPWKPLFAEGALWVPNQRRANITRINVSTLEVTHVIDVGTRPGTPILYDGAIWVASAEDETVTRIQLP